MTSLRIGVLVSALLLLLSVIPVRAEAATLSLSPGTGVYTSGQTFTASVVVNTAGDPINAAEGTLTFNTNELSVVGVSKGSIFSLWTAEPSFSNSAGTISFSGGSPSGYTGGAGNILNITFKSKGSGTSKVSFSSGSVLAADGRGTNVLTSMSGGTYTISSAEVSPEPEVIEYVAPANTPAAPRITSTTHPDQNGWYTQKTATLSWALPNDVTAVRTLLDGNSGTIPTRVYQEPISSITLEDLSEGVQYFHLQFQNAEGWGRVAHYRLAVDTEKPEAFAITLVPNADLSSPQQILALHATDTTSFVRRFLVQIDGGDPYEYIDESGSSTITLPTLEPGHHTVIIEAFDAAGNSIIDTFSFAILAFDKPQFTEYPVEIAEDVIPVIKGITRPGAEVTVTVRQLGVTGENLDSNDFQVVADETGVFTFIPESRFQNGVYELVAVAIDAQGAKSEPSDPIRIAVQQPGYIMLGAWAISVLSVIVPLFALVLLLVLLAVYFVNKLKRVRRVVTKETDEALAILDREFASLTTLLRKNEASLAESRKTKKLTKAETELVDTMRDSLAKAQATIKKEIAEVDDIVE